MSVLFILIGASLVIASGFLLAFIRAAKSGQFDDSYTPSVRMLFDDETNGKNKSNEADSPAKPNQHQKNV